jgi:hypothetical protein
MRIMELDRPYTRRIGPNKAILRAIVAYIVSTTLLLVLACPLLLYMLGDLGAWVELLDGVPDRIVAL